MRLLATVLAIASGLFVLLGYFYPVEPLLTIRLYLTSGAMMIAATAVLVGIYNLVAVQMEKIRTRQKGAAYGAVLVVSLIFTFFGAAFLGPDDVFVRPIANAVLVPVEGSLMAILAVTLIYASIRLFRRRVDVMSVVFLTVALISLIAVVLTSFNSVLGEGVHQFVGIFSSGGARGLLIGIALGAVLTGLRVIFGVDRPYGGN